MNFDVAKRFLDLFLGLGGGGLTSFFLRSVSEGTNSLYIDVYC